MNCSLQNFRSRVREHSTIRAAKEKETGVYYRLIIEHVNNVLADIKQVVPSYDEARGFELAGFVWFQGWNDMVDSGTYPERARPGGYEAYSDALAHFIRDIRQELNAPELPFVIAVLGVGGPTNMYGPERRRVTSQRTTISVQPWPLQRGITRIHRKCLNGSY